MNSGLCLLIYFVRKKYENMTSPHCTLLYYLYVDLFPSGGLDHRSDTCQWFQSLPSSATVRGRIRVAKDGLNATLGGPRESLEEHCRSVSNRFDHLPPIDFKFGVGYSRPGAHMHEFHTKICDELVTLQLPPGVAQPQNTGKHLIAEDFHKAMMKASQEHPSDVAFIDCRNSYETDIGTFECTGLDSYRPRTRVFASFPKWVNEHAEMLRNKKQIFMVCTGGVRCERASAYVKERLKSNSTEVFQLSGGIQRYMEAVEDGRIPIEDDLWKGKLFVFDDRPPVVSSVNPLSASAVLGKCCVCEAPYDVYKWLRCNQCTVLVLCCDSCDNESSLLLCRDCSNNKKT